MSTSNENNDYGLREYLGAQFDNLNEKVDGTNSRLDRLNGKVAEHSVSIKVLQDHDNDIKKVIIGLIALIVGTVVVGFLTGKL